MQKLRLYADLIRLDKPIGIFLLLWPTLWALWAAAGGLPDIKILVIFVLGVVLMRSAGCAVNDFADRHVDLKVERTKNRPVAVGKIKPLEALIVAAMLSFISFLLVLQTNLKTILLSFIALFLAISYPFMKRWTYFPQIVLGAAFAWSIPMAFSAVNHQIPMTAWVIYVATLVWTVSYDALYAMVDREDDLAAGVKSIAIFFGQKDKLAIALLQSVFLVLMCWVGWLEQYQIPYFISIFFASILFLYQHYLIRHRQRMACFRAFLHNNWVGFVLFIGFYFGVSM
jgi:4-hydroxybenzoate polyprenyltransferase